MDVEILLNIAVLFVVLSVVIGIQFAAACVGLGLNEAAKRVLGPRVRLLGLVKMTLFLGLTVATFRWVQPGLIQMLGYLLLLPALVGWLECLHAKPFRQLANAFEKTQGFAGVLQRFWILMSAGLFVGVLIWAGYNSGVFSR